MVCGQVASKQYKNGQTIRDSALSSRYFQIEEASVPVVCGIPVLNVLTPAEWLGSSWRVGWQKDKVAARVLLSMLLEYQLEIRRDEQL
jgi:hypothetical protein